MNDSDSKPSFRQRRRRSRRRISSSSCPASSYSSSNDKSKIEKKPVPSGSSSFTMPLTSRFYAATTAVTMIIAILITELTFAAGELQKQEQEQQKGKTTTASAYQSVDFTFLTRTEHQRIKQKTMIDMTHVDLNGQPADAADNAVAALSFDFHDRLSKLFEHATTPSCRAKIVQELGFHVKALALEEPLPFMDVKFNNTCDDEQPWDFNNLPEGVHMGIIQNRTYQPPRMIDVNITDTETNVTTTVKRPNPMYILPHQIRLCYGILAHDSADATIRFIEAVEEPTTVFVVHIDAKYETTQQLLREYFDRRNNDPNRRTSDDYFGPRFVLLDDPYRIRVNWGGFTMVNATMQMLRMTHQHTLDYPELWNFTHFIHMASTAYPIASNRRIRNTLADFPSDANFLHIVLKPARPHHSIWNYFVECDDRLHRIHRLPVITKETHNADFYTSSQWFIISRDFAMYLADPPGPNSFVVQYLDYIEHAVVADESFFGTVLRNTHFCNKHHNWNFLHLQFDRWENERDLERRDSRKCVMPDPNHCGRSPTTITLDYLDILELTGDLYARKFIDDVDSKVKNVIDTLRAKEELEHVALNITRPRRTDLDKPKVDLSLEGHGVLIVAKETVNTSMPMCLGLAKTKNLVRLMPCFHDDVIPTLAPKWETGAVIQEEVFYHNRWMIGPCSSDGNLHRQESGDVKVTPGLYTPTGPRCMFTIADGLRAGRCLDGESLDNQPGGPVHVYPCTKRWNQYLSFGDGIHAPAGSIHTTIPLHTSKRIEETGREQPKYMCLGVAGRGELDEDDWFGERGDFDGQPHEEDEEEDEDDDAGHEDESDKSEQDEEDDDEDNKRPDEKDQKLDPTSNREEEFKEEEEEEEEGYLPLHYWVKKQLMATQCGNQGAVIQWILVPFIVEEEIPSTESSNATEAPNATTLTVLNETGDFIEEGDDSRSVEKVRTASVAEEL